MPLNIIDKIWKSHIVHEEKNFPNVVFVDLQLVHEVTSPQAFSMLEEKNIDLLYPKRHIATIDHSIPTDPKRCNYKNEKAKQQVETLRKNIKKFGIQCFDVGSGYQGIVHIIGPELGLTQPGKIIVCGDSHTSTHGAFGALAFGIGTTQVGHVMASQSLLLKKPKTMKVNFIGNPDKNFSAKDAILFLIYKIGIQGGTGYALEFCGDFIKNLSMEGRMTICNMAIECGAKSGVISPDQKTFSYLKNKKFSPKNFDLAVKKWENLASSKNSIYDKEINIDITNQKPRITWGTNPEQSIAIDENIPYPKDFSDSAKSLAAKKSLDYTKLIAGKKIIGTKIDYVFIGSCTNGRFEDMMVAAKILENKKCAPHVKVFIVPGSEKIYKQCQEKGLEKIFVSSGADFRQPGCSMCLAMNGDFVPSGKRCVSTSNRNFIGRQGTGSFTHLASPRTAAIAAIKGEIFN